MNGDYSCGNNCSRRRMSMDMDINKDYADMIMGIYSGKSSELSQVMQYLYHARYYEDNDSSFTEDIEEIIADDMEHMDILGDLIKRLGGNPKYKMGKDSDKYWCGDVIDYKRNFCDMLAADMKLKKDTISEYKMCIKKIDDDYLKGLLKNLLRDEVMHYNIFEEYYENYCSLEKDLASEEEANNKCSYCKENAESNVQSNEQMEEYLEDENNMYAEDEYTEPFFCEKGKHFIYGDSEPEYDCEAGCGCNQKCDHYDEEYVDEYMDEEENAENIEPIRYRMRRPRNRIRRYY